MEVQNIAISTFAAIITNANVEKLKDMINSNFDLIELEQTQKYLRIIRAFRSIPIIGGYVEKIKEIKPEQVLEFIKEKNTKVYQVLTTDSGIKWFYRQFRLFMENV